MKEKEEQIKQKLCKLIEKIWIALSFACVGFIIAWLCIGVFFFGGVNLA
ncbi:MAG: hypothetical protein HFF42_06670 [Lawsonibacter sp.]|jgi:hypothetical protein|nr:hypothetical protein [Lawsonibacter sp.]